jgi:heterotetrameric sarcosine oxidase gamma subunit
VNELGFLAVDGAQPSDRFRPVARSPMARRLREAGAEFTERDGWLVAVSVAGEDVVSVAIRDVTHAYRVDERSGDVAPREGAHVASLRAGRSFVATRRDSAAAESPPAEGAVDLSAGFAALEIEGPGASQVMRRLTDLDLDGLPAVGAVAHVRTFVFRHAPEGYVIFFRQEFGHHLWDVVVDAAKPLGGGPKA